MSEPLVHQSADPLSALRSECAEAGIEVIQLTNFDIDGGVAGDLDLYVPRHQKEAFLSVLREQGWLERREQPKSPGRHYYYYLAGSRALCLDVKYELEFYSGSGQCWRYGDGAGAIQRRVRRRDAFSRPAGADAILLYVAHLLLEKEQPIQPRHLTRLARYLDEYIEECNEDFVKVSFLRIKELLDVRPPAWGESALPVIAPAFVRGGVRRVVRKHSAPGAGFTVLFLGADGTGKTTLVSEVAKHLNLKVTRLYLGMGASEWRIPLARRLMSAEPRSAVLRRLCRELFNAVALPAEFLVRRFRGLRNSRYRVVLIDRFPGFPFVGKGRKLGWLYQTVLPRPDLIIFLHGEPRVIVERRPEHSYTEYAANSSKFEEVVAHYGWVPSLRLDTTQNSLTECTKRVTHAILASPRLHNALFRSV